MSNSNVDKIDNTNLNENEQENDATIPTIEDSSQKKETAEELSKSETKMNISCDEDSRIRMDNARAPSIVSDTVLEMGDRMFQNLSCKEAKWDYHQNMLIKKFLKRGHKNPELLKCVYKDSKIKLFALFTLTRGKKVVIDGVDYYSRNRFIKLVMAIVMVMLLITATWLAIVFHIETLFNIFIHPPLLLVFSSVTGMMGVYMLMLCVKGARRAPVSYVLLVLSVICTSLMASIVTCRYRTTILIYAFITTSFIVFVCILLAFTSFDFTSYYLYFIVISVGFSVIVMSIIISIILLDVYIKKVHVVLLIITVVVQSVGLVLELQMILGDKSIEMDEDDYILAAFMLYTAVMKMFLNIVQILGMVDSD